MFDITKWNTHQLRIDRHPSSQIFAVLKHPEKNIFKVIFTFTNIISWEKPLKLHTYIVNQKGELPTMRGLTQVVVLKNDENDSW